MCVRLLIIISLLLVPAAGWTGTVSFSSLNQQQNPVNPGYAAGMDGLSSFVYNPALVAGKRGLSIQASYAALPFGFSRMNVSFGKGKTGFNLNATVSDLIPEYTVNQWYDAVKADNTFRPSTWVFLFSRSGFSLGSFQAGFSVKYVYENLSVQKMNALLFDAGICLPVSPFFQAGFSLRNIGIPFYIPVPGSFLPVELNGGGRIRMKVKNIHRLEGWLSYRYIVLDRNEILSGIRFLFTEGFWTFGPALHCTYSLFDQEFGWSAGLEVSREKDPFLGISFNLRRIYQEWNTGVSVSYGYSGVSESIVKEKESEKEPQKIDTPVETEESSAIITDDDRKESTRSIYLSEEKVRLAVMDLEALGLDESIALTISDLLRTELFKTELFILIERKEMQEILKEQEFQVSGCAETECAVQLGRLLSAHKVLVGTLSKLGDVYILNARMVDVETGEMEFGEKVTARTKSELIKATEAYSRAIVKKMR